MKPIDPYEAIENAVALMGGIKLTLHSAATADQQIALESFGILKDALASRPDREQAIAELMEAAKKVLEDDHEPEDWERLEDTIAFLAAMENTNAQ